MRQIRADVEMTDAPTSSNAASIAESNVNTAPACTTKQIQDNPAANQAGLSAPARTRDRPAGQEISAPASSINGKRKKVGGREPILPPAKRNIGNRAGSADPSNKSAVSKLVSEVIAKSASATANKQVVQVTDTASSGDAGKPAKAVKTTTTDGAAPSAAK